MLFVSYGVAWKAEEGAGQRGGRECGEPPCMEGRKDGGAWEALENKSVHKSDLFCVALTGGGVEARAAAAPPPPPPPTRQGRLVVEETKRPS